MLRPLKIIKYLYYANNLLVRGNIIEIGQNVCSNLAQRQALSFNVNCTTNLESTEEEKKKKKTKTPRIPKISLIYPDGSMTVVTLEDAERLAKRRSLQLIKMPYIDTKSDRDVYKLCSSVEVAGEKHSEETSKDDKKIKSTKLFPIQSKITDHDLDVKLNNVNKLLTKRHRIKLLISFTLEEKEKLLQNVKRKVQGVLSEERSKQNSVILIYLPSFDSESSHSKENIGNTKKS